MRQLGDKERGSRKRYPPRPRVSQLSGSLRNPEPADERDLVTECRCYVNCCRSQRVLPLAEAYTPARLPSRGPTRRIEWSIEIMEQVPGRNEASKDQAVNEANLLCPFPDDTIAAILATDPDVSVNDLLRARSKARRLLAIYRAGAARAATQSPPAPR